MFIRKKERDSARVCLVLFFSLGVDMSHFRYRSVYYVCFIFVGSALVLN